MFAKSVHALVPCGTQTGTQFIPVGIKWQYNIVTDIFTFRRIANDRRSNYTKDNEHSPIFCKNVCVHQLYDCAMGIRIDV